MATTVEARSHRGPDVIDPTRMVNLSDAVFAIAMTLLVLGIVRRAPAGYAAWS